MASQSDNVIRFPGESIAKIEVDAAAWISRMTSGEVALGELAEFEFWRAASPDHDRVYREMDLMWDRLGNGAAPRSLFRRILAGLHRADGSVGWPIRFGQIAAALVALVVGTQYLTTWRYEYHTEPGEVRKITLADGSVVHLNGGTALDARVSSTGARVIDLAKGEAFFEVVHDPARPFTVIVGGGAVHDIGTGFSIQRNGRSANVAVEHGIVAVVAGGHTDVLTPGKQVTFNQYSMGPKQAVDTSVIAAWRRGLYVAEGKPLGAVLADIDKHYSGRIIVTSQVLAARRVNAVVQFEQIDAWLDALNEAQGVAVRRWGPLTIVSDRPA